MLSEVIHYISMIETLVGAGMARKKAIKIVADSYGVDFYLLEAVYLRKEQLPGGKP